MSAVEIERNVWIDFTPCKRHEQYRASGYVVLTCKRCTVKPIVHDHGAEEADGLSCNEVDVNGRRIGACLRGRSVAASSSTGDNQ